MKFFSPQRTQRAQRLDSSVETVVGEKKNQLTVALVSAAILLGGWISSASSETVQAFGIGIPTLCGFKLLTTWDCPGCGLTRSLILALHGQWTESYAMHIWGIPLMGILLLQVPYRLFRYLRPEMTLLKLPPTAKRWVSLAIFLSVLLPWAVRTIATAVIRYL